MSNVTRQFLGFASVGLAAAVIHYGVLIVVVETDLMTPVKGNLLAYLCGGTFSYLMNRRFAFRSDRSHSEAAWRFALVAVAGFLLTGLFTYLFQQRLGVPYLLAAVMTSAVVLTWNFIVNRVWTFPDSR